MTEPRRTESTEQKDNDEKEYRSFESYKERYFGKKRRNEDRKRDDPDALGVALARRTIREIEDFKDDPDTTGEEDE